MPFVNGTVLVVSRGMKGATQNIYTGLCDFYDCAFLLHLMRKEDLFVDIGANVGVYTVLASAAIGASSIAIEPVPETYARLSANIRANSISDRATGHNIGLGQSDQMLRFTADKDCTNHVITDEEWKGSSIDVPVRTLDAVLAAQSPILLKLDVEGWESKVLAGATATLRNPSLFGLVVEMDGTRCTFNTNEANVHSCLLSHGFAPYAYDAFARKLMLLPSKNVGASNTLYLRNLAAIEARISSAPAFTVNRWSI
jgi:FkbM family methyltransferase